MLNCSYTVRVSDIGPYIATATASTPVGQRSNSKNAIQVNFAKAGQTSVGDCVTVSEGQSVDGPGKMPKANYLGKQAPPKTQKVCRTMGFKVLQQLGSFEKVPCGRYTITNTARAKPSTGSQILVTNASTLVLQIANCPLLASDGSRSTATGELSSGDTSPSLPLAAAGAAAGPAETVIMDTVVLVPPTPGS